jgi:hypothetical protein
MKALSIRQPWSWLIVNGYKTIENRDWPTRFRGPVLIHASKIMDPEDYEWIRITYPDVPLPPLSDLERGGIVGQCEIVGCVTASTSRWFVGRFGFVLRHARPLPFQSMPGKLGFFDVPFPRD